ncbi:MAG: transcriptional repressor [Tannerella sp.]|jgi:Fe2+ or Zn2+ uptake regulation protein|nr:transcriptional repressor [Tannerella sp.]
MNSTSQYLSGHGIRPSVQRLAIMHYLWNNRTHPTADEIFEALRKQIPTLSKTTVYNTLKLFVDQGAAMYIGIDEKNARFDGFVEPHAHFRCKKCGKIIDLDINIERFLPNNFNGMIEESYFYLKGLCADCKNTI